MTQTAKTINFHGLYSIYTIENYLATHALSPSMGMRRTDQPPPSPTALVSVGCINSPSQTHPHTTTTTTMGHIPTPLQLWCQWGTPSFPNIYSREQASSHCPGLNQDGGITTRIFKNNTRSPHHPLHKDNFSLSFVWCFCSIIDISTCGETRNYSDSLY